MYMGNKSVKDLRPEDFANVNPWLVEENTVVGTEKTPLVCFVAKANLMYMVDIFIKRRFNFNVVDFAGNCPLHYAADKKTPEMTEKMLEQGLDPLLTNKFGQTPLLVAVLTKRYHNVKILSSAMFIRDRKGNGPIHYAIRHSDESMVRLLVENTPYLPWWELAKGYSDPLSFHLNYFCDGNMFTCLSLSVIRMDYNMASCLIDMGADKGAEYNGKTPKSILAKVGSKLQYGGICPTKTCTNDDVIKMWGILSKDIDVYRNVYNDDTQYTGLISGTHKYLT